MHYSILLAWLILSFTSLTAETTLVLRNHLQRAKPGDYIVVLSDKTETLMHIYDKNPQLLTIEEIAIPKTRRHQTASLAWPEWLQMNAPGHTSWVMYEINLQNGQMERYYSFTKRGWYEILDTDNTLSKLLNLKFKKIPEEARKRVGCRPFTGHDRRPFWQPPMIVNGQRLKDVLFDAWKTKWPKDGSDLSGKTIEVYLPQDSQRYPSYFPYWLQISNLVGKAKIRIIDSGQGLKSPKLPLSWIEESN
jgi:hypothetical protein